MTTIDPKLSGVDLQLLVNQVTYKDKKLIITQGLEFKPHEHGDGVHLTAHMLGVQIVDEPKN